MFFPRVTEIIVRSPLLAYPKVLSAQAKSPTSLLRIKPEAILDVLYRRGRSLGLSALYEESRLKRIKE